MGKVQANTRLDQDTAERLEQHADENDLSKAEVARRAIREYLAERGQEVPATDGGVTTTDEIQRTVRVSNVVLAVAILWLGAVVALDPPGLFTILTGTALAGVLGLVLARGLI